MNESTLVHIEVRNVNWITVQEQLRQELRHFRLAEHSRRQLKKIFAEHVKREVFVSC